MKSKDNIIIKVKCGMLRATFASIHFECSEAHILSVLKAPVLSQGKVSVRPL